MGSVKGRSMQPEIADDEQDDDDNADDGEEVHLAAPEIWM
jgi:hypothetical protein